MRLPHFDLSRLNPRNLFRRDRAAENPAPVAEARSLIPDRRGARPTGDDQHIHFAPGIPGNHERPPPARGAGGNSGATSRSASPPPGYEDDLSDVNSLTGSPPNPFRSDSPAPSYAEGHLRHDVFRLDEDGIPYAHAVDANPGSGPGTPSTFELGEPITRPHTPGRRPDTPTPISFANVRPESMNSEQLDAYLDSLPPLSRLPTPPPPPPPRPGPL